MAEVTATFTYGPKPNALSVAIQYEGDDTTIALGELTLHVPATHKTDKDAFTCEAPAFRGSVVYDRDPGQAALQLLVLQRRVDAKAPYKPYTLIATVDGHEMHSHTVMGDESWIAWQTTLPDRPVLAAPTGTVTELNLEGGVSAAGDVQ